MALSRVNESPAAPTAGALALQTWRTMMRHVWFKSIGTTAFTWVFFLAYFDLLKHPNGAVTVMPMTALDRWIGFQPWALPFYFSLWLYVSLPPALMATRREIIGFGARMAIVCLIGLGVFYVWPTQVPAFPINWAQHPGFAILRGVDAAGNACPSLHVATAVFAAFWLDWMVPALGFGRRMRCLNMLWCALIVFSTLATKQHVVVDAIAGALLGASVAWATRPRPPSRFARAMQTAPSH
ncbi:MAG: phosphatase PAP2 family protein [Thiomonas sp.]|uniref:Putative Acid phosphatase/vanadium-dependent haloperoxidase n=1 Tax=mine drainage metagenome TaxID=410659 RepID=E6PKV6_9ZZZZ